MHRTEIGKAVQLLDLMLEFFANDGHWARGCYDDGKGGHCLVGALLHLSRKHRLPRALAIALLQDAMPRPGLPLVHYNDACCGSVAELRSVILKARRLADDHASRSGRPPPRRRGCSPESSKKVPPRRPQASGLFPNASPPSALAHSEGTGSRLILVRMWSAVLVQTKGFEDWLCSRM